MDAEERPDRCQAAEKLLAEEAVATVDAFGACRRQQDGEIIARLGMTGREDLAGGCAAEQPLERPIAGAPEVGGDACPVQVHVDGNRGCRRVVRQAPLFAAYLGQAEAPTAELVWNRHAQITRRAQLLEVLIEEPVVAIVAWRPLVAARQQILRQDRAALRPTHCHCRHLVPRYAVR
jgi:hypothetical protein